MEEITPIELPDEPGDDKALDGEKGLTRRDFMIAATLLSGSMLLMLSGCDLSEDGDVDVPPVPPEFRRFTLVTQSPTVETEKIVVAAGSQCPDLACAMWWSDEHDIQNFESIQEIERLYVQDGTFELIWLD